MTRLLLAALAVVLLVAPAAAIEPDEILADPALEARARTIGAELRCLVCQNQSIDDSAAPLARDLRIIVRERLVAGDSNPEVIAFVVDRYGDYVLLRPPFKASTWLLWAAPFLALAGGGAVVAVVLRRRQADPVAADELSAEDKVRLEAALRRDDGA